VFDYSYPYIKRKLIPLDITLANFFDNSESYVKYRAIQV